MVSSRAFISFFKPANGSPSETTTSSPVSVSLKTVASDPFKSSGSNSSHLALTTPYCLKAHLAATLYFLVDSMSRLAIHQFISLRNARHSIGLPLHVGTLYQVLVPPLSSSAIVAVGLCSQVVLMPILGTKAMLPKKMMWYSRKKVSAMMQKARPCPGTLWSRAQPGKSSWHPNQIG